jgi:hypothetical protein
MGRYIEGEDRSQAKGRDGTKQAEAIADRGYFASDEIKATLEAGIAPLVPKPMTSNVKAEGRSASATSSTSSGSISTSVRPARRSTARLTPEHFGLFGSPMKSAFPMS